MLEDPSERRQRERGGREGSEGSGTDRRDITWAVKKEGREEEELSDFLSLSKPSPSISSRLPPEPSETEPASSSLSSAASLSVSLPTAPCVTIDSFVGTGLERRASRASFDPHHPLILILSTSPSKSGRGTTFSSGFEEVNRS